MTSKPKLTPNQRTASYAAGAVAVMVAMSFAAVPAYKAFCQVTGFDGTTQRASAPADHTLERKITVQFDATVGQGLPWRFHPEQMSQTIKVGQSALAFYEAENLSDRPITGRATFNVSPSKAGLYFRKIECFCFTEQVLQPGEKVSMPVTYFIDPEIADDHNLDDVQTVTLSYTFFPFGDAQSPAVTAGGAR